MKEECLICGAPLEYLETDVQMQCEICRKKELAKTRCVNAVSYTHLSSTSSSSRATAARTTL